MSLLNFVFETLVQFSQLLLHCAELSRSLLHLVLKPLGQFS